MFQTHECFILQDKFESLASVWSPVFAGKRLAPGQCFGLITFASFWTDSPGIGKILMN